MGMLRKKKTSEARDRLKEIEKRFDFKDLEKRLSNLDLKELEKRIDLKDLEKKLDFDKDLAKRFREMRLSRHQEQESSSAGFIAGLVVGAIVGVVLAIVFGKKNNGEMMDQFAHRAETLRGSAGERYNQADSTTGQFGDDAAIEREITGEVDVVESARDTIDSASEDVQDTVEDVQDTNEGLGSETERRFGQA